MAKDTPRAQIARFVRAKIASEERIEIADLVEMVIGHFGHDQLFVDTLLREQLSPIVYTIAQNVVAQTRSGTILVGTTLTTASAARQAAATSRPRWQMWLEHTGRQHVRLPEMTREELLSAAQQREQRADREMSIATLWRALAFNLAPGQRVGDFYDDAAIDRVIEALQAGNVLAGAAAGAQHGLDTGQLPRAGEGAEPIAAE